MSRIGYITLRHRNILNRINPLSQNHHNSEIFTHAITSTLSQISPCFYVSAVQSLKTQWRKEKLLVMTTILNSMKMVESSPKA